MAITALKGLVVHACLILSTAVSLAPLLASAQDATTNPQELTPDLAEYFSLRKMALVIETTEKAPFGSPYDVLPLTREAGLDETDMSKLPDINAGLVMLDHTNFTHVNYTDKVVFLCCDPNTSSSDDNLITPDWMLNTIMDNAASPTAILLYSTTKPVCFLGGQQFTYKRVWTMTNQDDAIKVRAALTAGDTDNIVASITPNSKAIESQQPRPGSTSAIAMSILYSITGLITLLFLLIIGTGAVRAHRNPERYGPRASVNGRPRRSRARGLAMAMLETLPIVKFGESDQRKPDEETALETVPRPEQQPQEASRVVAGDAPNDDAVLQTNSELANNESPQHERENAPVATTSAPDASKKESNSEEDHPGCSICTEDFTVGEDVRVLPCNHKFHPACVDPWLVNVSGTCPLCRLDLRPPEEIEHDRNDETATSPDADAAAATATAATADGHLAPPTDGEQAAAGEATHRRRRSRLLDWNRLRNASVDERLQALRQYRQSQQSSEPASNGANDERRHSRLTGRLRERFHIRSDSRNGVATAATSDGSLPPASTVQH